MLVITTCRPTGAFTEIKCNRRYSIFVAWYVTSIMSRFYISSTRNQQTIKRQLKLRFWFEFCTRLPGKLGYKSPCATSQFDWSCSVLVELDGFFVRETVERHHYCGYHRMVNKDKYLGLRYIIWRSYIRCRWTRIGYPKAYNVTNTLPQHLACSAPSSIYSAESIHLL